MHTSRTIIHVNSDLICSVGGKFRKRSTALIHRPDFILNMTQNKSVLRLSVEFILQLKGSLAAIDLTTPVL